MIVRVWRGVVHTRLAAEYADVVERTGIEEYRRTEGNLGAQLLTRDLGDGQTEFVTLSWWPDLETVRGFAGDDIETAKYYPEDDRFLADRDATVRHYRVDDRDGAAPPTT